MREAWPKALADAVNASSGLVAIGQLANGVVTPVVGVLGVARPLLGDADAGISDFEAADVADSPAGQRDAG